jgi:hypothetical protein
MGDLGQVTQNDLQRCAVGFQVGKAVVQRHPALREKRLRLPGGDRSR